MGLDISVRSMRGLRGGLSGRGLGESVLIMEGLAQNSCGCPLPAGSSYVIPASPQRVPAPSASVDKAALAQKRIEAYVSDAQGAETPVKAVLVDEREEPCSCTKGLTVFWFLAGAVTGLGAFWLLQD